MSTMPPPSGVNESCDEFTDPVVVLVEFDPCIALAAAPKRTSFPSRLPPGFVAVAFCDAPAAVICGLPLVSRSCVPSMGSAQNASITAKTAQPCRLSPTIFPNVYVSPKAMRPAKYICRKFVRPFGFSNGWPELAL